MVELRDEVHRLKTQTAVKLQAEIARSRFSISEVVIAEAPQLASREWVRRVEQFDAELLRTSPWSNSGWMIVLDGRIVQLGDPVDESTLPHHEIHMVRDLD